MRRRGRLFINLNPPLLGLEFAVPPIADLINGENDLLPILGTEFKLAMNSGTIPSPSIGDIFTPWAVKTIIAVARYTIVEGRRFEDVKYPKRILSRNKIDAIVKRYNEFSDFPQFGKHLSLQHPRHSTKNVKFGKKPTKRLSKKLNIYFESLDS